MGAEKCALGIFERGERKYGVTTNLYSRSTSKKERPRIVKEAIIGDQTHTLRRNERKKNIKRF